MKNLFLKNSLVKAVILFVWIVLGSYLIDRICPWAKDFVSVAVPFPKQQGMFPNLVLKFILYFAAGFYLASSLTKKTFDKKELILRLIAVAIFVIFWALFYWEYLVTELNLSYKLYTLIFENHYWGLYIRSSGILVFMPFLAGYNVSKIFFE